MIDVDPDNAIPAKMSETAARRRAARISHSPHFSLTVGAKIKAARVKAGLSQTDLGNALSVAFQQVQKYENGANRVAADTLQVIGEVLGMHLGSFFDGHMPAPSEPVSDTREAMRTAVAIQRIRDLETRRQLLALAEEQAEAVRP